MSLRINLNSAALNAHRQLQNTDNQMASSIEKLSSGYRINRSADDPAGLVISENLRSQVSGLTQAISNSQDAINMVKTAEGALTEVHSLLRTMRDLAVHASNVGMNDSKALEADQAQIASATAALNRIAVNTQFGTKKLLNGTAGINGQTTDPLISFMGGTAATVAGTYAVTMTTAAAKATKTAGVAVGTTEIAVNDSITINGTQIDLAVDDTAALIARKINAQSDKTNVVASEANGKLTLTQKSYGSSNGIVITGSGTGLAATGFAAEQATVAASNSSITAASGTSKTAAGTYNVTLDTAASKATAVGSTVGTITSSDTLSINGKAITLAGGETAAQLADKINGTTDIDVTATVSNGKITLTQNSFGSAKSIAVTGNASGLAHTGFDAVATGVASNSAIKNIVGSTSTVAATYDVTVNTAAAKATLAGATVGTIKSTDTLSINGKAITLAGGEDAAALADAINNTTDIDVTAAVSNGKITLTQKEYGSAKAISVTGNTSGLASTGFDAVATGVASSQTVTNVAGSTATVAGTYNLTIDTAATKATTVGASVGTIVDGDTLSINGKAVTLAGGEDAAALADAINNTTDIDVTASASNGKITLTQKSYGTAAINITGNTNGLAHTGFNAPPSAVASDASITGTTVTTDTAAGVYDVNIITQATKATKVADATVGTIDAADTLSINGKAITIAGGESASDLVGKINGTADIDVVASESGGVITLTQKSYGSAGAINITGTNLVNFGLDSTTDAAGTDAEAVLTSGMEVYNLTGVGDLISGNSDDATKGLSFHSTDAIGDTGITITVSSNAPVVTAGANAEATLTKGSDTYHLTGTGDQITGTTGTDIEGLTFNTTSTAAGAAGTVTITSNDAASTSGADAAVTLTNGGTSYILTGVGDLITGDDGTDAEGLTFNMTNAATGAAGTITVSSNDTVVTAGTDSKATLTSDGTSYMLSGVGDLVSGNAGTPTEGLQFNAGTLSGAAGTITVTSNSPASTAGADATATLSDGENTYALSGIGDLLTGNVNTATEGLTFHSSSAAVGSAGEIIVTNNSLKFQVGANAGQTASVSINDVSANKLGATATGLTNETWRVADIDVTTFAGAQDAIKLLDASISEISATRSELGSFQKNQLESNINSLGVAKENIAASESSIRDADMAAEMVNFTRNQIMSQAGTAMLTQANQAPQNLLSLLR